MTMRVSFAWASSAYTRAKRMVLGQCEKVMFQQGGWKKARQEQQMRDWFGFVPVYLITIDASFCENEPYRVCRRVNILRDYPDDKTKLYPRN